MCATVHDKKITFFSDSLRKTSWRIAFNLRDTAFIASPFFVHRISCKNGRGQLSDQRLSPVTVDIGFCNLPWLETAACARTMSTHSISTFSRNLSWLGTTGWLKTVSSHGRSQFLKLTMTRDSWVTSPVTQSLFVTKASLFSNLNIFTLSKIK